MLKIFDDWQDSIGRSRKAAQARMRFLWKFTILFMIVLYFFIVLLFSGGGH